MASANEHSSQSRNAGPHGRKPLSARDHARNAGSHGHKPLPARDRARYAAAHPRAGGRFADWNARKFARSLLGAVAVVFLVSIIAFALAYLSPTDAAIRSFSGVGIAPTEEQLAAKRAELGLDQPFLVQYFTWISNIFQGELGTSYRTGAPVSEMIFQAIPYTLALSVTSILLTLVIAIPIGLVCAARRGGVFDQIMRFITYFFNAMPSFFVALLLLYVLSVRLRLFGVMATRDFAGILMPTLAMALPLSAWFARQVRAQAIEQLGSGYVDGLRARGVSEARILWVHVLRNLSVPLLTLVGVSFGLLLGGSAIVESIFNWPGVGLAAIEAVGHRDYPFIGAYALAMAVIYLLINALVDGSYRFIDPRVARRAAAMKDSAQPIREDFAGSNVEAGEGSAGSSVTIDGDLAGGSAAAGESPADSAGQSAASPELDRPVSAKRGERHA